MSTHDSRPFAEIDVIREAAIRVVAEAMHTCTSHPDYPAYDEAPCCGTPTPAMGRGADAEWHHQMNHERGSRGICWACEPAAAAAVDALLAFGTTLDTLDAAMHEPCYEEIYSLDYFRRQQVDAYWITCTKVGPHDEHEDSNTGAHWPREQRTTPAGGEG